VNKKDMKDMIKKARRLARPIRVTDDSFRLKDVDPGDTLKFTSEDKPRAKEALEHGIGLLAELQDMLYAQDRWAVLLIFQAMDAAGKDGAIKHVMSGVNPQGVQVYSFKSPSSEDLDHDYLWRCMKCLPERGRIGIFNRSYYEETLVVRVHPEFLDKQHLPPEVVTKHLGRARTSALRALSDAQRRRRPQVLPAHLQQRAAEAVSQSHRGAREELEVLGERRQGTRALG
jgi:polyphosphate kinase 2 (PPK2 family)